MGASLCVCLCASTWMSQIVYSLAGSSHCEEFSNFQQMTLREDEIIVQEGPYEVRLF